MRMAIMTQAAGTVEDWGQWANAWLTVQVHGEGALTYIDHRISQMTAASDWVGLSTFDELRGHVARLQKNQTRWSSRSQTTDV